MLKMTNTKHILNDFVKFRLKIDGLSWEDPREKVECTTVEYTMRTLGIECEDQWQDLFLLKFMSLNTQVPFQNAHEICNDLFKHGENWTRIVGLVSWTGFCVVKYIKKGQVSLARGLVDWMENFFDKHLNAWIAGHGGWDGLVRTLGGKHQKFQSSISQLEQDRR